MEERPENAIPKVHMDYCFMGRKSDDLQHILVARYRDTRMIVSFLVQKKGAVDDSVIRRLLQFFRELGYQENKVVVRSDQESPMLAVTERGEAQTISEHSPMRSSGSKGVVERAIKEVEYQVRTMKSAIDQSVKTDIGAESNILTWMIECAGVLINWYLVGKDGKAAYECLKGIGFAVTVMFRRVPLPGKLAKLESLWENGILAGYRAQSGEYMVICDNGVYKTRTIRRSPKEERWDRAAIEEVRFTSWMIKERSAKDEFNGCQEQEHRASVDVEVNKDIEVELTLPPRYVDPTHRRIYITKAVVDKFGGTDGCLGCTTALLGGTGVAHNEQCRERIEKLMRKDPSEKPGEGRSSSRITG